MASPPLCPNVSTMVAPSQGASSPSPQTVAAAATAAPSAIAATALATAAFVAGIAPSSSAATSDTTAIAASHTVDVINARFRTGGPRNRWTKPASCSALTFGITTTRRRGCHARLADGAGRSHAIHHTLSGRTTYFTDGAGGLWCDQVLRVCVAPMLVMVIRRPRSAGAASTTGAPPPRWMSRGMKDMHRVHGKVMNLTMMRAGEAGSKDNGWKGAGKKRPRFARSL